MVDRPASIEAEVEALWVELEMADQLAVGGDDADVVAGDQEMNLAVAMADADQNLPEPSQIAESDAAVVVDLVLANAIVGRLGGQLRGCLDACVDDDQGSSSSEGAVRSQLVIAAAEEVELSL